MNTTTDNKSISVTMTSIQKYWYHASLCTGDFRTYSSGYFMICSNHHAALCNGCSSWSTAIEPRALERFAYLGSSRISLIDPASDASDICWNGIESPIPSLSASFALAG